MTRNIVLLPEDVQGIMDAVNKRFDVLESQARGTSSLLVEMQWVTKDLQNTADDLDEKADRIEAQVKATNGRVTKLEMWQTRFEGFQSGAKGSWGLLFGAVGLTAMVTTVVQALAK